MAERSFTREVQQLTVAEGTEFHGEGILAVTKALLEAGVGYVTGYQGAPISHLMDVLSDAQPILDQLGVYFEPAASEAGAAAALSASVNYPVRGSVCAGPVEPYDDPSMFDDTTNRRSVSIARPGPTRPSQVPVVSSSSPGGAWPLR